MKIRTRFAPSPTGRMHVGNLRTALYAYLIAKHEEWRTTETRKTERRLSETLSKARWTSSFRIPLPDSINTITHSLFLHSIIGHIYPCKLHCISNVQGHNREILCRIRSFPTFRVYFIIEMDQKLSFFLLQFLYGIPQFYSSLSAGRNPQLTQAQIEDKLKEYLNVEKVLWLPRGIYNDETNEHDVVCCVA